MCSLGGGSSDNSAIIQQQQQEAEAARQKEAERQARVNAALAAIKAKFEGTDTFKTVTGKPVTVGATPAGVTAGSAVSGLPAGYTYTLVGATPATTRQVPTQDPRTGVNRVTTQSVPGQPGTMMVTGPDGKTYAVGSTITPTTQQKTGHSGGFDTPFFDKFRNAITSYYLPQVAEQFRNAQDELTFRLARAGSSQSSAGNKQFADLTEQNKLNIGNVKDKADKAVGDLKTSIGNQRASAESQVMAAENPEVAATSALANVKNISAAPTDLTPLADVFDLAAVGTAGAVQQFNNQRFKGQAGGFNSGATRIV